ncbi:MAG: DNA translocase FtsK [Clostridiales bacterium]|nr:DNA translocase FtsK [Clostridiales bacterium]
MSESAKKKSGSGGKSSAPKGAKTGTSSKSKGQTKGQAKASSSKRPTKKELEQLRIEEEVRHAEYIKKRNQTNAIIVFAAALVLFSIVLIPASAGTVWFNIRGFIFGLLGYSAYIMPCIMVFISIMMALERMKTNVGVKLLQGFILVLFISGLMYVIVYPENHELSFSEDVNDEFFKYFDTGSQKGWGIFGAVIGEILMLMGSSKLPAIAILSILILVSFMFLTGFTLIRLIKGVQKPAEKVKGRLDRAKQDRVNTSENIRSNAVSEKPKDIKNTDSSEKTEQQTKRRKRFPVYTEADLLDPEELNGEAHTISDSIVAEENESDDKKTEENVEDSEITAVTGSADVKSEEIKDIFEIAAQRQAQQEEQKLSKSEIDKAKASVSAEIDTSNSVNDDDNYSLPPLSCLKMPVRNAGVASQADLKATADKLIEALNSFNVDAKITEVVPGPSVTRYEVAPAPGVKISKFTGLADDLALHLAAPAGVRIEAPIPNKSAIGIEVPNRGRITVTMREVVDSDIYRKSKSKLNVALGKDIAGNVVCADLAKMPHLLIAGTTGSGKSVCLNAMIVSLLYNAKPSEVKLLLIDPKQVEFSVYNGIPHLLVPVVSDPRKAAGALGWAVTEMLNRYKILNEKGTRDIYAYNKMCESDESMEKMSQIVIFIDELSDLMSVAPSEVENSITRLAQMARAAGMHLVVATQRPSVDVITGLIKANIPSRIALSVSSQVDSRTILDSSGAEKLLGLGDMLFSPVGKSKPVRVQGCYLSDGEIENVVDFVKTQQATEYDDNVQQEIDKQALSAAPKKGVKESEGGGLSDADNEIVMRAAELVIDNPEKASISAFQRSLSMGFAKAGRIMDILEEKGVVGPHAGSKPRKVLMTKAQWYEMNAMAPDPSGAEIDSADGAENTDSIDDYE